MVGSMSARPGQLRAVRAWLVAMLLGRGRYREVTPAAGARRLFPVFYPPVAADLSLSAYNRATSSPSTGDGAAQWRPAASRTYARSRAVLAAAITRLTPSYARITRAGRGSGCLIGTSQMTTGV